MIHVENFFQMHVCLYIKREITKRYIFRALSRDKAREWYAWATSMLVSSHRGDGARPPSPRLCILYARKSRRPVGRWDEEERVAGEEKTPSGGTELQNSAPFSALTLYEPVWHNILKKKKNSATIGLTWKVYHESTTEEEIISEQKETFWYSQSEGIWPSIRGTEAKIQGASKTTTSSNFSATIKQSEQQRIRFIKFMKYITDFWYYLMCRYRPGM